MWLEKLFIIITCSFGVILGREYNNSTDITENFVTSTYFNYNGDINRIVGGRPISILRAPYQVALYRNRKFFCGGSILSIYWTLTAAHCAVEGGSMAIRAGSRYIRRGGQIRFASLVIIHSGFNIKTFNHDIALLRVRKPFNWTNRIRPVRLARPGWRLPRRYLVSGWGIQQENSVQLSYGLRAATVKSIPRRICRARYRNDFKITKYMICAASSGRDSCQGDSGGPLVFKGIQYGVVSFGIGCALRRYPGVYTDVRSQYSWITNVITN